MQNKPQSQSMNTAGILPTESSVKISYFQLAALLSVSAIFAMTSSIPFTVSHSMERFVTLGVSAGIMILLYTPLMVFTAKRNTGLLRINNSFLKWFFGSVILIRLMYTSVLTAVQMNIFIINTVMTYLSAPLFIFIVFVTALYGANKGIQAAARAAPVSLFLYIFIIITVSILMWNKTEIIRIYSPFYGENGVYNGFTEAIRNDELFFFAVLSGFIRDKESKGQGFKSVLYYLPFLLITGLWLNFLYNVIFGRALKMILYPLHGISVFSSLSLIERMDGLFVTSEVIGGIIKLVLAFICMRVVIAELISPKAVPPEQIHQRKAKIITSVLLAGVAGLTYFIIGHIEQSLVKWSNWHNWLNLIFAVTIVITALVLPVTVLILSRNKTK